MFSIFFLRGAGLLPGKLEAGSEDKNSLFYISRKFLVRLDLTDQTNVCRIQCSALKRFTGPFNSTLHAPIEQKPQNISLFLYISFLQKDLANLFIPPSTRLSSSFAIIFLSSLFLCSLFVSLFPPHINVKIKRFISDIWNQRKRSHRKRLSLIKDPMQTRRLSSFWKVGKNTSHHSTQH